MAKATWTDYRGVTHQIEANSDEKDADWSPICNQNATHYGAVYSSVVKSIRKTVRARKKRRPVTCFLCAADASSTRSESST